MEIKFITEGMACAKCEARVVEKPPPCPVSPQSKPVQQTAQSL